MWSVAYNDKAAKVFKKLDSGAQRSIKSKLDEISRLENPGDLAKPLQHDLKGRWRLHIQGLRVIFSLERNRMLVLVIDIGRRDSVYD